MSKKTLDTLFNNLKKPLRALIDHIQRSKQPDDTFLKGNFSFEDQLNAGKYLLKEMGYDFKKGRLDTSAHPFSTTFHPHDSRITTRIDLTNFMNNISTVLHEGGHALYEMGLRTEFFGSPLCETVSLGVHESQSRFWETRIGQSKAFCKAYLPYIQSTFNLKEVSLDKFYKAINLCKPSLIRVDADEITYSLHVILRYELEVALLEGSLKVKDLPQAWNAKMEQYLGITPPNDSQGCLQDVHWSIGELGYFPTYTLGNLYAAHFFQGFEKSYPNWQSLVEKKELGFIKEWLNENIYRFGKEFKAVELIEKAANGKPFSSEAYIDYLERKYKEIY
jgi:carboxypeptidase Taq